MPRLTGLRSAARCPFTNSGAAVPCHSRSRRADRATVTGALSYSPPGHSIMPGVATGTAHWMLSARTLTGIRRSSTRIPKSESRAPRSPSTLACWQTSRPRDLPLHASTCRGPLPATRTYSLRPARVAGAPVPHRVGSSAFDEQAVGALAVPPRRRHCQARHRPQRRARHHPKDRRGLALAHHRQALRQSASFAVVPAGQYFAARARP